MNNAERPRGVPSRTVVRCAVTDFELQQGVLRPKILLVDTKEANILGDGVINLQNETLDLRIHTEPKHPGIVSLRAPVPVRGQFKKPSVKPEMKNSSRAAALPSHWAFC